MLSIHASRLRTGRAWVHWRPQVGIVLATAVLVLAWSGAARASTPSWVRFQRIGDPSASALVTTLNLETLTSADTSDLLGLLARAQLDKAPRKANARLPAAYTYRIQVEYPDAPPVQVEFSEQSLPDNVRPLLNWLQDRAQPIRIAGR